MKCFFSPHILLLHKQNTSIIPYMKTIKKVSIVVPVYNVENYLDNCIESILAQTHRDIEIILVDDGSTDNSGTICDKYAKDLDFIKVLHKTNEGVNYARRDGFNKSNGKFITFVDSDDIISPDFIKTHLELLNTTSADITVGKVHNFYGKSLSQGEIDQCRIKGSSTDYAVWKDKKDILSAFITSLPPYGNMALMCAWSKLYRREVIEKIDWEISNYKHGEDYFMNAQAYNTASSVCYVNEYCYYYRRNRSGKLTTNASYNISPNGERINNFEYIKALSNIYINIARKSNLDLDKELVIFQCRLFSYWLEKLIDMNELSPDIWENFIKEELFELITKFKSEKFKNYMQRHLTCGEKLYRDLYQKLDPIYQHPQIEKYLQYKLSIVKEQGCKPQNYINYENAWVVMDRENNSTDNGYHFYQWVKKNDPTINLFFVINQESKDVSRLKSEGFNLVYTDTDQHKELLNKCIVEVYAYYTFNICKTRTSFNSLKVYLGHGIKLSNTLNPGLNKKDLFVTTFKREFDFFNKHHDDFKTIQTGMPRFENLLNIQISNKSQIIIAPQWRRWLNKKAGSNDKYFVLWSSFIQSKELKILSLKYKIVFMIHPEIESKIDFFGVPKYIQIIKYHDLGATKIQNLIKQTKLLITDFSSVAIDYALTGSDVIYFQFDRNKYYNSHTAQKGWYDYDLDGLGPVFVNLKDLIKYIANFGKDQNTGDPQYKKRLKSLISKDYQMLKSPSKNIYDHIIDTLKNKQSTGKT